MGSTASKEEVIISQAGISGGTTNSLDMSAKATEKAIIEYVLLALAIIIVIYLGLRTCRKFIKKTIKAEVKQHNRDSTQQV